MVSDSEVLENRLSKVLENRQEGLQNEAETLREEARKFLKIGF